MTIEQLVALLIQMRDKHSNTEVIFRSIEREYGILTVEHEETEEGGLIVIHSFEPGE